MMQHIFLFFTQSILSSDIFLDSVHKILLGIVNLNFDCMHYIKVNLIETSILIFVVYSVITS